ncbi:MAG: TetR/AcrR family transcriptional regulator C-terminal domain-containing protein [Acetobacter sp.]|nr:TetR/AcrR family transcriptional regulator C-terminal domain-containing protein [Bacteroides sp.]MCM1340655.1 TetR/AcrR family transcriptional regulator C-terminal domain-containing protein [Acetobacter sp.]MCM1433766.1 TetR/AcrR family transcriptional regulator C-terminal domain-containing protein [Clostridiales bacterium]
MPKNSKLHCSFETQISIANALKELMKSKSFEKISISDITNECSIHRQTFYYHFEDKYDLLNWIVLHELVNPLIDNFNLDNMYQRIEDLFTTMVQHKSFYKKTFHVSVPKMSQYIGKLAVEQISDVVASIETDNGVTTDKLSQNTMSEFLGYGIAGVILSWAQSGMKDSPQVMTERIKTIINACKKIAVCREK